MACAWRDILAAEASVTTKEKHVSAERPRRDGMEFSAVQRRVRELIQGITELLDEIHALKRKKEEPVESIQLLRQLRGYDG